MARLGFRRSKWTLLACFLAVVALPTAARCGEALRFNWPLPCRVGVASMVQRDSLSITLHYVVHVYATPHPDELKLQFEDVEILDMTVGGRRVPGGDATMAQIVALLANRPPITLSRSGKFLRSSLGQDVLTSLLDWSRKNSGPVLGPTTRRAMERVFRSPEMSAQIQAEDKGTWDAWVGSWVGLQLEPGESLEATAPLPIIDGPLVEGPVRIKSLGSVSENPRLTGLHMESTTEGDAFREAIEKNLRAMARLGSSEELPPGRLFTQARRTYNVAAIHEPGTLRPNFAATSMMIELDPPNGDRVQQFVTEECRFEWDPPLASDGKTEPVPAEALDLFHQGKLEEAYAAFKHAAVWGARNPDTFAYLAESSRRLDGPGEAVLAARRALALSPRHGFAHCVLADTYDDRAGGWGGANEDSSWTHFLRAVDCDSSDGNAWMGVFLQAKRRERRDLERQSLSRLSKSGFLTPATLAYARWTARDLPDSAVLLTNGDLDSYPLWAVQELERVRPDVAVVNYHLLNLAWYARNVRDRLRVPISYSDAVLDALAPEWAASEGRVVPVAEKIVRGWLDLQQAGSFRRPLAVGTTVPLGSLPTGSASRLTLAGSAWICHAAAVKSEIDVDAVGKSLEGVRASDFAGPPVSEFDRSPVRRGSAPLSDNIVAAWVRYAQSLLEGGDRSAALKSLDRVEEFARKTGASALLLSNIEDLRKYAGETGK